MKVRRKRREEVKGKKGGSEGSKEGRKCLKKGKT